MDLELKPFFMKGQIVVYPGRGLAVKKEVGGEYELHIVGENGWISVPVGNEYLFRPLASELEVNDGFLCLRAGRPEFPREWRQRRDWFAVKIKSGKLMYVAEVLRAFIILLAEGVELTPSDKNVLVRAKKLFISEVAVVELKDKDEFLAEKEAKIANAVEKCFAKGRMI